MVLLCERQFISGDVKWCAFPTFSRFYFNQAAVSFGREARNFISCTVAVFLADPSYLLRKVMSAHAGENSTLMLKDALLTTHAAGLCVGISDVTHWNRRAW